MHSLARQKQALQKLGTEILKLLVELIAHELEDFLDFLDEDDLLAGACDRPVL